MGKIKGFVKSFFKNIILDVSFRRFILVGIINTLVGLGVNYLLLWLLGMSDKVSDNAAYWIASAANYIVGSILSFFLNKYYTFRSSEKSFSEVMRFVLNILVCWIVAYGTARPFIGWLFTGNWIWPWENVKLPGAAGYIATLLGAGLFVILNYFGQRFFAFKKKSPVEQPGDAEDGSDDVSDYGSDDVSKDGSDDGSDYGSDDVSNDGSDDVSNDVSDDGSDEKNEGNCR